MRILAVSALLGLTAACTAPPPQAAAPGTVPTATAIAAALGPPPPPGTAGQPVALLPPPAAVPPAPAVVAVPAGPAPAPVVAAIPASTIDWVPLPRIWFEMFQGLYGPGPAGRLTLSNYSFDTARVQAVLTNAPSCGVLDPAATADFEMPLNATRIISTPAGVDVCWRHEAPAGSAPTAGPGWAEWNRAYTASGRFIDARL